MRLSLRRLSLTIVLLLGLVTLSAVAALVLITAGMERSSARMLKVLDSVQVTEELEKTLLLHERERQLLALTGQPEHAATERELDAELRQWLARARRLADTPAEAALVDALSREVEEYLAQPAPPSPPAPAPSRRLDRELGLSEQLVDLNLAEARAALDRTRRWDRLANLVGLSVSVALVAGVALVLNGLRRHVYRPLQRVRGTLARFRLGAPLEVLPRGGVQELGDIADAFNETASRLERQRDVQLGFLAGVAHDLRTPLQALRTVASALRPGQPLPPEEKMRERFDLVARQVDRLARMVDDLLDVTRIEAGQLSLEQGEHDLVGLVREAVELHRPVSAAHTLVTSMPEHALPIRGDSTRLLQVLNNLLSNAIKYSPAGGTVRVTVGEGPEEVWVEMTDPGVGIPEAERESIFEPFRRSSLTRGTIPGVGLGLSVARRIVQAHGGSIEVESAPGRGSTFRVRLPRARREGGSPRSP